MANIRDVGRWHPVSWEVRQGLLRACGNWVRVFFLLLYILGYQLFLLLILCFWEEFMAGGPIAMSMGMGTQNRCWHEGGNGRGGEGVHLGLDTSLRVFMGIEAASFHDL
jgi:hypothetical protein